ncbi:hypothetical protein MMB232_01978 [Brevundimonas subvibrioides]|uniref:glycosyltransferase family 61 protein n=1 Tax=Brevundimonas subvibrioides TaxID=74313 RepID=UPI0032D595FA
MDISELISGFHAVDTQGPAPGRKQSAFKLAHKLSGGADDDFHAFLGGVPRALTSGSLSSESMDNHFCALFGAALNGRRDADTFLAAILHALVLQLTYQGRHRPAPEIYVLGRGGDQAVGEMGLLNSFGVPAYCLDEGYATQTDGPSRLTLSRGSFEPATAPYVLGELAKSQRQIGCLAFLGVGYDEADDAAMVDDVRTLGSRVTSSSFFLFAGQANRIARIYSWLSAEHPQALLLPRFYWHDAGGAAELKGLLVVSGLPSGIDLANSMGDGRVDYTLRCLDEVRSEAGRTDIQEILVRDLERVKLQTPTVVSTSAPLLPYQAAAISDTAAVRHLVLKVDNGRVIDSRGPGYSTYVIATEKNELIDEYQELGDGAFSLSPYFAAETVDGAPRRSPKLFRRPTREVPGACLLLTFHPTVHNFHSHFLIQCFPRVQLMNLMGIDNYSILAPFDLKNYQVDMLEIVGIDRSRIIRMDPSYDYVAGELYVPKLLPAFFTPLYAEIYDSMIQATCPEPIEPYRRIIISREARTSWRNMFSFDAVAQILIDEHGFELVSPDKLSIEDEIRLFREAKIVVGAEGAGLYNCCFMSPGSHVVCLADQDYVMPIVGSMAFIRGFGISYVFGESFMADSDRSRRSGHANFVVDPARVSAVVAEIIERA